MKRTKNMIQEITNQLNHQLVTLDELRGLQGTINNLIQLKKPIMRAKKKNETRYGIEITKPFSNDMYSHNDMVAEEMKHNITSVWADEMIEFNKTDEWPSDGNSKMHTIQSSICATGFGEGFTIDEVHTDFMSNLSNMANWQLHEEYSYLCFKGLVPRTAFPMLGFAEENEYHEPCHDKTVLI
tara:strand:+ start:5270 stop:5818 length:549 start_codon:yes stop_codon:yes gene_type:complete